MHKYETHIENAPLKTSTWKRGNRNVVDVSHFDHYLTQNHFLKKTKRFSSFTISYFSCVLIESMLGGEQEIQKGTRAKVWRALRGKVQVCHSSCASQYKKMLQLIQHSCQQDKFRAGQGPRSLLSIKGFGNWQDSLLNL